MKVSIRNYTSTIRLKLILKKLFFIMVVCIQNFCMFCISKCREGVNAKLHLHNTRPSVHLEIDHFLSWLYTQDFCMFCISKYREGINTKLRLHYKTKLILKKIIFLSWLYIQDFCMFCISKCRELVSMRNYTCTIQDQVCILKLITFYHSYTYRISVCFVFPSTGKVSIRNYTCTIRLSIDLEIDYFYHGYITGFLYVFIFKNKLTTN